MTVLVPDCSNNNWGDQELTPQGQQNLISFLTRLPSQGFGGIIHKFTQGAGYIDPYGALCRSWCQQNNFCFISGYHYVTNDNPTAQVQNWQAAGGGPNVYLDFEDMDDDGHPTLTMGLFWAVVNSFNAVGVNVPATYLPAWYAADIGADLSALSENGIALVSSAYPQGYTAGLASDLYTASGGDAGEGWNAYANGSAPNMWQFTSSATISGFNNVDCNAYRGSNLNALFTGNISQ